MNKWMYSLLWVFISGCLFAETDPSLVSSHEQGVLELPKGMAVYVNTPDGSEKLIDPNDRRAVLPAGTYRIRYWVYRKKDANGNLWRLHGYGGPIKSFEIGEESTSLDIKAEPVEVTLSVRASDAYLFIMKLKGPAGEIVYLYKGDNTSQPPPILITNQDKSFSVSVTGKYG